MLRFALVFFIFSLFAALFGFTGLAAASAGIAQTLFYIFLGLFVLSLIISLVSGTSKEVVNSSNKF